MSHDLDWVFTLGLRPSHYCFPCKTGSIRRCLRVTTNLMLYLSPLSPFCQKCAPAGITARGKIYGIHSPPAPTSPASHPSLFTCLLMENGPIPTQNPFSFNMLYFANILLRTIFSQRKTLHKKGFNEHVDFQSGPCIPF